MNWLAWNEKYSPHIYQKRHSCTGVFLWVMCYFLKNMSERVTASNLGKYL